VGKVLQFPIFLKREVIIPGKLYFDWRNPGQAVCDLAGLQCRGDISPRAALWAHAQIEKRWDKANENAAE
jgi:hypothetical protein